jgi:hypothetical protein
MEKSTCLVLRIGFDMRLVKENRWKIDDVENE